jgi:hypothetical protein
LARYPAEYDGPALAELLAKLVPALWINERLLDTLVEQRREPASGGLLLTTDEEDELVSADDVTVDEVLRVAQGLLSGSPLAGFVQGGLRFARLVLA